MHYDDKKAYFACHFFEDYLTHTQDQWDGKPFKLARWQREALQEIYGNVDDEGLRVINEVYLEVPKKSGKSSFVAGLVLLTLYLDQNRGCQVYGAASCQRQALNVFRVASAMVEKCPQLRAKLDVLPSTHRIVKRSDRNSFYAAIAADGDLSDGVNPAMSALDELHRWRDRKMIENYDVLTKSGITRKEHLTVSITTAGIMDESPLAWRLHEKTVRMKQGIFKDPKFYGRIYGADRTDDWTDPKVWVKANPSLVGNPGGFVPVSAYQDQYNSALTDKPAQRSFRRYFLNLWDEKGQRAFEMDKWDACKGNFTTPGLLPKLPEQKVRSFPHEFLEKFMGRVCIPGVDLSFTRDMSAVAFVFPDDDEYYDVLPFFWMPENGIRERELHDGMPYRDWAVDGYLELCPGDAIDYREIKARLLWGAELFDIPVMCFDRYNSREMSTQLIDEGYNCAEISQGFDGMNGPVKKLLEIVNGTGKLRHGGHPVLRWNALCADIEEKNDLVKFVKPRRQQDTARIDGLTASATSLAQAMLYLPTQSVYETRGVITT